MQNLWEFIQIHFINKDFVLAPNFRDLRKFAKIAKLSDDKIKWPKVSFFTQSQQFVSVISSSSF